MKYQFIKTRDHAALVGIARFGEDPDDDRPVEAAVFFWMNYAWTAFCLQWVAISWCAVIGREQP